MFTKLAIMTYPEIPKHILFTIGYLLVVGILWVGFSVNAVVAVDHYAFEKNDLSVSQALVAQGNLVSHKSTLIVSEYSIPLWRWFYQTDFESTFWCAVFFVLFSSTILGRSYIVNREHYYSILLNWIKSIQASTS